MRLLSLTLQNFQAHENLTVDFDSRITVITGPTDKGKSAILRALRWLCQNDIAGDEFIRYGTKQAIVTLKIKCGKEIHEITRTRSASINTYELDGKEYKSFGNSVPANIATLLNINEINFQNQHDAPYWFSETAGEVSRQLNAIIDLDVIDTALSHVASEVRKSQERKSISEERLTSIKNEYEQLKPQEQRIEDFDRLQKLEFKSVECAENCDRLVSLGTKIRDSRNLAKTNSERAEDGSALLLLAENTRQADIDFTSLQELVADISHYRAASTPPPEFVSVNKAFEKWDELEDDCEQLKSLLANVQNVSVMLEAKAKKAGIVETQFHKQIIGMKCPTCGKQL